MVSSSQRDRDWFRLSRARVHGAIMVLRDRTASLAARVEYCASIGTDERELAAMRGKLSGYREAIRLLEALEENRALRSRRWKAPGAQSDPGPPIGC